MLALGAGHQDLGIRKDLEVMRDRRLRDVEVLGDLAAGQLARGRDLLDHTEARRVGQGLERSSEALANVSKLVGDTAAKLDERLGQQYGDYARSAATTIEETANKLAAKDAYELIDDTREFVRKSPGVALAGAAVLGFALVRLVKSGLDQTGSRDKSKKG